VLALRRLAETNFSGSVFDALTLQPVNASTWR
jgi:hypothetical protein